MQLQFFLIIKKKGRKTKVKRKLKLVKAVVPELVATKVYHGEEFNEYRCNEKNCGCHLTEDMKYCPWCGSKLNWNKTDKHLDRADCMKIQFKNKRRYDQVDFK